MNALTLDTLQFVRRLKKAGVQDNEAEAIAEVIAEAVRGVQTNADIATKRDIAETKAELIKWVVSVGVLQTALIGALLLRLIPD
jgi:hypothetical protein